MLLDDAFGAKARNRSKIFLHELYITNPVRVRLWFSFDDLDNLVYWFDENSVGFNSGIVCVIRDAIHKNIVSKKKARFNSLSEYSVPVNLPLSVYKPMADHVAKTTSGTDFYKAVSLWMRSVCSQLFNKPGGNDVELEFRARRVKQTVLRGFFE